MKVEVRNKCSEFSSYRAARVKSLFNVESGANFRWLCAFHHRGAAGAHCASHSDWEGEQYIRGLIT